MRPAGYEVAHATFHPLPTLEKGYELIAHHLQQIGRPIQALCGMELRIPQPLSPQGFAEFNAPYVQRLADWEYTRRQPQPDRADPTWHWLCTRLLSPHSTGFPTPCPRTIIVRRLSCPGRLKSARSAKGSEIVSQGDVSPQGVSQKAQAVLAILEERLQEFSVVWTDVTAVELYTVHNVYPLLEAEILPRLASGGHHGLRWHYARPPVTEIEYEMDARAVYQECVLPG